MHILSYDELQNINGGAIVASPYYGFVKVLRWISNYINHRF